MNQCVFAIYMQVSQVLISYLLLLSLAGLYQLTFTCHSECEEQQLSTHAKNTRK